MKPSTGTDEQSGVDAERAETQSSMPVSSSGSKLTADVVGLVNDLSTTLSWSSGGKSSGNNSTASARLRRGTSTLSRSNTLRDRSNFTVEEILQATGGFSEANFIGSGGQSTVYKGIIRGTTVAVKKFHDANIDELISEVNFSLRHPHVVLLLGCCAEANCVVSEFMPGGSLHDRLVDTAGLGLDLSDCLRIFLEMVSALMFLHNENIAHRDLKPANVLLDEHKKVKIADMGLATEIIPGHVDYGLFGTEGYTDPYYIEKGVVSKSSDIYSLGLIVLQLLTGWQNVKQVHHHLSRCSVSKGLRDLESALREFSPRLSLPANCTSATRSHTLALLWLALQCVGKFPQHRPHLDSLWKELKFVSEAMREKTVIDLQDFKTQTQILLPIGSIDLEDEVVRNTDTWSNSRSASMASSRAFSAVREEPLSPLISEGNSLLDSDPEKAFNIYRTAAVKGFPEGQYHVGKCFENGIGVDRDFERSYYWYGKAEASGHGGAKCAIGRFFADGIRVPINETQAVKHFQASADSGNPNGLLRLAFHLFFGFGVEKDPELGQILAQRGMRDKDSNSDPSYQYSVGMCFQNGIGVTKSMQTALQWYSKSADQWYPPAWHKVGEYFLYDKKKLANEKEGFKRLELAANSGFPMSQNALGECYRDGIGTKRNFQKAVELFKQASDKGHYIAQCNLGKCFTRGEGVIMDVKKAAQYFEISARKGFVYAQYCIGSCFLDGVGVERNWEMAAHWLAKAAKQVDTLKGKDSLVLLRQLAEMLEKQAKTNAKKNVGSATQALALLAEEGHGFAQLKLGNCFQNGWGVEKNLDEAEFQWTRALKNGEKGATAKLKKLNTGK